MKNRLFLLIAIALCLVLSACGGQENISGEVVEATPSALILEMRDGERVAVLLEEDTHIFGMDDIDGDNYKAAPHTGVRVSFFHGGAGRFHYRGRWYAGKGLPLRSLYQHRRLSDSRGRRSF